MKPTIDIEFQSLVHPLTHEEKAGLERQLLQEGCLDALKVWGEENILLDGHNRFDLCTLHNIPFKVEYLSLKTRDAALLWIVCNQLSRRNSTEEQKAYLRGKRYELEKKIQGGTGANQHKEQSDQNDHSAKTAEKLAKEFNVSAPTIRRDEQFAKGVDAIAKVAPEAKQDILAGKSAFTKQEVRSMAAVPKQADKQARAQAVLMTEAEIQQRIDEEAKRRAKAQLEELQKKMKAQKDAKEDKRKAAIKRKKEILRGEIKEKPVIHQMECLEFLDTIEDESVDLLLTDPPYSTDVKDITEFAMSWTLKALRKVKKTGRAFICIGAYPIEVNTYLNILLETDYIVDAPLIWTYRNTLGVTPKMKYNLNYQMILHVYTGQSRQLDTSITNEMFSVQDITAPDGRHGTRLHAWQKPDELALRLIRHTTQEGEMILDCFACTGTFPLMSAKMKRRSKSCDISVENLAIAEERGCHVIYQ